jgi:hypothetical protein
LLYNKIFADRLRFDDLNLRGLNPEFQRRLPVGEPDINSVRVPAVHPVFNDKDSVAEDFRDFYFRPERQEVGGNNTIADISAPSRYKRRVICLVES